MAFSYCKESKSSLSYGHFKINSYNGVNDDNDEVKNNNKKK